MAGKHFIWDPGIHFQALMLHPQKHCIIAEVTCIRKDRFIVRDGSLFFFRIG